MRDEAHTSEFEFERRQKTKSVLFITSGPIAIPLFLGFSAIDYFHVQELWLPFLGIRLSVIPAMYLFLYLSRRAATFHEIQKVALMATFYYAQVIFALVVLSGGSSSSYYAGLNLVCIGMIAFIPWDKKFIPLAILSIYGPFTVSLFIDLNFNKAPIVAISNFAFILGTIVISATIRVFQNKLEKKEFESRMQLKSELEQRTAIIQKKTAENLKLNLLSRNFSPQVVDAVMNGKIEIATNIKRANICSFFIDIADSTSKMLELEEKKFAASIEKFLDIVMNIATRFDATIDKFNGDQIVAFSNDPVEYTDYVERTLTMAFLIRERIKSECDFFLKNWGGPMDVYIGLASGSANVGFYGHKKIMQSYTALGPPVNLAARLCSDAERNEILISAEIAELVMNNDDFSVVSRGRIKLHGFEEEVYFYRVEKVNIKINESHVGNDFSICEKCSGRLTLLERKSVWYYRCNSCEVEF